MRSFKDFPFKAKNKIFMNYHVFDVPNLRGKQIDRQTRQTDRQTHTHQQFQTLYVFVVMVVHIQSNYILIQNYEISN